MIRPVVPHGERYGATGDAVLLGINPDPGRAHMAASELPPASHVSQPDGVVETACRIDYCVLSAADVDNNPAQLPPHPCIWDVKANRPVRFMMHMSRILPPFFYRFRYPYILMSVKRFLGEITTCRIIHLTLNYFPTIGSTH